ncbi:TPA: phage major capsid protein [Escherichia coli]|uniref:phage major capsid family protein n=1 Tax=Escherichia coli TaxID=562 RepID=UPI000250E8A2|nr:phage major capsid protein [Escherichia coli]HDR9918318.1 phage major capsid protein [Escherichia coli RDEC-1 (10f)]EES4786973.1 major capsid protein [Escherichia coli]EEZ1610626.1 major capsid protein [Escherichia coli]EHV26550.1 caudovirus prohead protease family protein [Escherichia coli DEC5A]EHW97205.1 caudovirus prohead protease family protein [Escherichia coli DEC10F]
MLKFRRDLNGYGGVINEGQNDQYEFEIAFSSEQPYQRRFWDEQNQEMVVLDEILVHTPEAVDLSRLNNNAPLLFNHIFDNHIGVVCNARIDADKVGRATVRFSKHGTLANDIRNKVIEGTMEKISVGYDIKEYHIDYAKSQLIVSKWIPHEVSWVSVPADDTVGLNRSLNTITVNLEAKRDMTKEQIEEIKEEQEAAQVEETPVEEIKEPEVEETQERQVEENKEDENLEDGKDAEHPESVDDDSSTVRETEEVKEEREAAPVEEEKIEEVAERSEEDEEEIRAIARELNINDEELERALAVKDMTPEAFRTKALNNITNAQRNNEQINKEQIMEKTFDLNNVIRSLVDGDVLGANEAEYSAMAATATMQRGRAARGGSVFVPAAAMRAAAAGNTKATLEAITDEKLMTESYIEMLMPESVLGRLGVTVYSGLNSPTAIPKMTKSSVDAFGFVDENGAAPESKAEFANVKLSPKTFAGGNPISRQSLKTVPGIASLITDHINKAVRIKLEQLILSDKDNERGPAGLVKQLVDASRVTKKAAFSYKDFLKEIAALTDAGVPAQAIKFAMSGATAAELESTLKDNGVSGYIIENGKLAGYEVITSGVIPADHIVLGDFSGITIGEWGGLELDMDLTTYRDRGAVVPRIFVDLDYVVAQPEALKVLHISAE